MTSSTGGPSRLAVVGPENAKYKLRLSGVVDPCSQSLGAIEPTPLPGLPPNSIRNVEVKCSSGAEKATLVKNGVLLITVEDNGFVINFEVALKRDLKA